MIRLCAAPAAVRSVLLVCLTVAGLPAAELPLAVRGPTAVLLKPDPGPFTLRLQKRDLNIYAGADELLARLYDPHRKLVGSASIPDDGQTASGPKPDNVQTAELRAICDVPGVYRLTVTTDGRSDLAFGFETNCPKYVVEAGETIMLNSPHLGGKVHFVPPAGAFKVMAAALHDPGRQQAPLVDAAGNTVHTFDLAKAAEERTFEVGPEQGRRDGLWHLDIGKLDVKLSLPGVQFWTADPGAYFPAEKTRWLLMPWSAVRYLEPGGSAKIPYTLRNTTGRGERFTLTAEGHGGLACRIVSPQLPVELARTASVPVVVEVKAPADAKPGATLTARLSAAGVADPEAQCGAGIEVRIGKSPVSQNLKLPLVPEPYRHENAQFGYAPDYVCNEVYFDRDNRAFLRERTENKYVSTGITFLEDGRWVERSFAEAVRAVYPTYKYPYMGAGFLGAKIAFDGDNDAYTLLSLILTDGGRPSALLHTPDRGQTWTIHELSGRSFDIEQFTGHNALDSVPPVLAYVETKDHPARFCAYHDLLLYPPRKQDGKLMLGESVLVSKNCLGSCQHSGGPASTATRDGRTHVVWGEVAPDQTPGVPTYVATYDHASGKLGEKVFLACAPPVNDVHNVPGICLDSEGYLHVITGAHGQPFKYRRSLKPNDAYGGWSEPVEVLSAGYVGEGTDADGEGRQTYLSFVCDPQDTLHIAYRQWRQGVDPYHGGANYAALSVQSRPKGQPWGPARPVVVAACPGYSIYYHKLTIDRRGRLFLSYSYYTADTTYQNDFPDHYHNRAVLVSKDGGANWKLAETGDFEP